jgi:hypothetical protein
MEPKNFETPLVSCLGGEKSLINKRKVPKNIKSFLGNSHNLLNACLDWLDWVQNISTPIFNPGIFNPRLFNHEP